MFSHAYQEYFQDENSSIIVVTTNQGLTPSIPQALKSYVEGILQQEGPLGDYQKTLNELNFNYQLLSEDSSIFFLMGVNDNGTIGQFRN